MPDTHKASRAFMRSIRIWLKVAGIIALVLVVVVMSATLLNAAGIGSRDTAHMTGMGDAGAHGAGDMTQMMDHGFGAGGHGSGDQPTGMDHHSTPATTVPR